MKSNNNIYLESLKKEILPNNKRSDFLIRILENAINNPLSKGSDVDVHHIFPVSWGGPNNKENLVPLLKGHHFKVHQLLSEVTIDKDKKSSMQSAYWFMSHQGGYKIKNHKEYEKFQEEYSIKQSEITKDWYSNMSKEQRDDINNKISKANKGRVAWNKDKKIGPNVLLSKKRKGHTNFKIVSTGEIKYLHKDDPLVKNGEAVGINRGNTSKNKGKKFGPLKKKPLH